MDIELGVIWSGPVLDLLMRCMTLISSHLSSVASVYTFMKWEVWTGWCLRSPSALKYMKCYLNGLKWMMERDIKKPKILVPAFKGYATELGNARAAASQGQESRGGNKIFNICWYFQAMEVYSKLTVRGAYPFFFFFWWNHHLFSGSVWCSLF